MEVYPAEPAVKVVVCNSAVGKSTTTTLVELPLASVVATVVVMVTLPDVKVTV